MSIILAHGWSRYEDSQIQDNLYYMERPWLKIIFSIFYAAIALKIVESKNNV